MYFSFLGKMFSLKSLTYFTLAALLFHKEAASEASPSSTSIAPSDFPFKAPTASPIPLPSPLIYDYLGKLATASFYVLLLANGGDYQAICDSIVPENLSNTGLGGLNGTVIKSEICAGAAIVKDRPELKAGLIKGNQVAFPSIALEILAVEIIGKFAGAPNLTQLCTEIEAQYVNQIFIGYTDTNTGTQIKDFICSAAAAASTSPASLPSSPSSAKPVSPTKAPFGNIPNPPSCVTLSPLGNTVLPTECHYGTKFNVTAAFSTAHRLFVRIESDGAASQAGVVKRCLEQCIGYGFSYGENNICRSIYANRGRPENNLADPSVSWYCVGYDAPLTLADLFRVKTPGIYETAIVVNRACEGDFRAY